MDDDPTKIVTCRSCGLDLTAIDYYADTYSPGKVKQPCRECHRQNRRARYKGEGYQENFERMLYNKYQLTLLDYDQAIRRQQGACALCGQPERCLRQNGLPRRLTVDYDPEAKRIRGLLCKKCTFFVGSVRSGHIDFDLIKKYMG